MSRKSGFVLGLGITLLAAITFAATKWVGPKGVSAAPLSASEAIYRPQLQLVY
jgi:hypothetical protein